MINIVQINLHLPIYIQSRIMMLNPYGLTLSATWQNIEFPWVDNNGGITQKART